MRILDALVTGVYPLQHQGYKKKTFDLQLRAHVRGVRITDRYVGADDMGEWEVDPDSVGDIHGGQLLTRIVSKRDMSMWRYATPVVNQKSSKKTTTPTKKSPTAAKACGVAPDSSAIAPIFDVSNEDYIADDRFNPITIKSPKGSGKDRSFSKPFYGQVGISLTTNNEDQQMDLFMSTDPRLIAVNHGGDKDMGSKVFDLNEDFTIATDRGASLQSALWVVKKPKGRDYNVLALNIDKSGCGDTEGGYVIGYPTLGTVNADARLIGELPIPRGGFIDLGSGKCRHYKGTDADLNKIGGAHLGTQSNFYRNDTEDGPLDFTRYQKPTSAGNVTVPVWCGWRGDVWAWWSKSWFLPPPVPTPRPRPYPPDIPTVDPRQPPPVQTGGGRPGVITISPGIIDLGGTATGGAKPPDTGKPFEVESPGIQTFVDKDGNTWIREKTPGGNFTPWKLLDSAESPSRLQTGGGSFMGMLNFISATVGVAAPAFAAKPQNFTNDSVQGGIFGDPGTLDDEDQEKLSDTTPLTGIICSYGAEGGTKGSGSSAVQTGAEGDPWHYTNRPGGRFPSGTASGGWIICPPETDPRDARLYGMVPPNTSLSTTYFLFAPGARCGFGTPEMSDGSIKEGLSLSTDSSTGDLLVKTHSGTSSPSTGFKFTKTAQDFAWASGTGFFGTLAHNISADRTWTFPNKDGTVAMTSDIGTGVSALATTYSDGSQTGIVTDVSIVGTSVSGSMTIASNYFTAGKTIRLTARGYYTTAAVPGNMTLKVLLGAATVLQTGAVALTGAVTQRMWELTAILTCRTTGVGGTGYGQGDYNFLTAGTGNKTTWAMIRTTAFGIDTTNPNLLDLVVTFDTAGNTIVCTNLVAEGIN